MDLFDNSQCTTMAEAHVYSDSRVHAHKMTHPHINIVIHVILNTRHSLWATNIISDPLNEAAHCGVPNGNLMQWMVTWFKVVQIKWSENLKLLFLPTTLIMSILSSRCAFLFYLAIDLRPWVTVRNGAEVNVNNVKQNVRYRINSSCKSFLSMYTTFIISTMRLSA